jgi:hypothetical protein
VVADLQSHLELFLSHKPYHEGKSGAVK